jgi:Zn-dependent protease with chaperone function
MFTLAIHPAGAGARYGIGLIVLLCAGFLPARAAPPAPAAWFPDAPTFRHYAWIDQPCPGCSALSPQPTWLRMASLAGLDDVHFKLAPNDSEGDAYSLAPNVVVLSPSAQQLPPCQLAFVIGHELAHIAQRHFDEDAIALSVYAGKPAYWTRDGDDAMQLAEGNFGLMLKLSPLWQQQEREADWLGALLAAQVCNCSLEDSALAYFRQDDDESGDDLVATHPPDTERIQQLLPFSESARRLMALAPD